MKKLKKILLPLACRFLLKPKSFSEVPGTIRNISCKKNDVHLLANTSNNVYAIRAEEKTLFFRECKRHDALRDYVLGCVEIYYSNVVKDLHGDKEFLTSCLKNKSCLKKFSAMGMTNDRTSGAYRFCMGQGAEHIGLPSMDLDREDRMKDLVQYIWGDVFSYGLNSGVKKGYFQTYNAVRCIATYRVAKLIGLEHMIPKTEYAVLRPEGMSPLFGIVMEEAPGVCMERTSCEDRISVSSPELQRALNRLNVLDALNLEKDHRPGNYHVILTDGKARDVVAFDNDSPNSFGMGGLSFSTYMGCSPWSIDGKLNRPYVDKALADRIIALQESQLDEELRDILSCFQLSFLKKRLNEMKKVFSNAPSSAFLNEEQWTEATVEKELSGAYGTTYLKQFLGEQKLMEQPWIKERACQP